MDFGNDLIRTRHAWKLLAGLLFVLHSFSMVPAFGPTAGGEERPSSQPFAKDPLPLLQGLQSSSYRIRRESFLQLCDRSYPVDAWLQEKSSSDNRHDAALANWLLQLRRTDGPLEDRLEVLNAFQSATQGDSRLLGQMVANGQWDRALEVLQILPAPVVQNILRDQGELGRLIELAWSTGEERIVPRLIDLVTPPEEKPFINRWWKDLGMPDTWQLSLPPTPSVELAKLLAAEEWDAAVQFAKSNGLEPALERVWVRSGNWSLWLEEVQRPGSRLRMNGRNTLGQKLAASMLLGRNEEMLQHWDAIKERSKGTLAGAPFSLALAFDDRETFQSAIEKAEPAVAFDIYHNQLGDLKAAFAVVGLNNLEPDTVRTWAQSYFRKLLATRKPNDSYPHDLLRSLISAFHQVGESEVEAIIDGVCEQELLRDSRSAGSFLSRELLDIWRITNQRTKAVNYLRELSIRKNYPLTLLGNRILTEESPSLEEPCFEAVFGSYLFEPFLIYEYLVKKHMQGEDGTAEVAIRRAFENLNDLHEGRKPKEWNDLEPLREMVFAVRQRIGELRRDDSLFCWAIAILMQELGDTQGAIALLQESRENLNSSSELASLLAKSGRTDMAATIMKQLMASSPGSHFLFLQTADLLERSGRYSELDSLRLRELSAVHSLPLSSGVRRVDLGNLEEHAAQRPEMEWIAERWRRLYPEIGSRVESSWRYLIAKQHRETIPDAYEAACRNLFVRAGDGEAFQADDSRTRILLLDSLPVFCLQGIHEKNLAETDRWIRMAHRIEPTQIQIPIDVLPWADEVFPKEVVDGWFDLYYQSMVRAIDAFPNDAVSLNNTAWMCALCGRNLDKAKEFADRAVAIRRDPTYLDTLAEVEFRSGRAREALELSQQCRALEPRDDQHKKQIRRFSKALTTEHE
ncbi:hypothetical protein SH467x_002095 [Pirellulaceae bacterium SH467]